MSKLKLLFILSLLLVFVSACAGALSIPIGATQTPTCDAKKFLDVHSSAVSKFNDQEKLANSTPRLSLAQIISQMQDTRRTYDALATPDCAKKLKSLTEKWMDTTIQAFIDFLGQQSETQVENELRAANNTFTLVNDEFKNVTLTTAGLPTPIPPTQTPVP